MQLSLSVASAAVTIAISSFFHYVLAPAPKREPVAAAPPIWSAEPAVTLPAD